MTTDTILEKRIDTSDFIKEPSKYKVIFCNDDVTPMEFVINLLISIFRHNELDAQKLTMEVHHSGSAVVGIYTYEIAEQKSLDATNVSRANGFPLVIKMESE